MHMHGLQRDQNLFRDEAVMRSPFDTLFFTAFELSADILGLRPPEVKKKERKKKEKRKAMAKAASKEMETVQVQAQERGKEEKEKEAEAETKKRSGKEKVQLKQVRKMAALEYL